MGKVRRLVPRRRRARRANGGADLRGDASGLDWRARLRHRATRPGGAPAALLVVLAATAMAGGERLAGAAVELLPGGAERVDAQFGRCGDGSVHCVIDGDTIRIGPRRIRLTGFDAPERAARCEAERVAAERAAVALQGWLNRGPFVMRVEFGGTRVDRYGRDLRAVLRRLIGGEIDALSRYMVEGRYARRYGGGARAGWC